jgi:hypothetical protein
MRVLPTPPKLKQLRSVSVGPLKRAETLYTVRFWPLLETLVEVTTKPVNEAEAVEAIARPRRPVSVPRVIAISRE